MAAPTSNSEKQLAWEVRHRTRAGIAAFIGALGLFLYFALEQVVVRDIPDASGLETFVRAVQPGSIDQLQSLRIPYWEYIHSKDNLLLVRAACGLFGFLGLAWASGFLAVATRARVPNYRRVLMYLPIIGGVVTGIGVLLSQIGTSVAVSDFLEGPRTVKDAALEPSGLSLFASVLTPLGTLVLAVGLVFLSNYAMRAGLLTRLFGFVGILGGAMLVICPLPLVHTFWLGGIGMLFLGRWPGGDLPAWKTGNAEPWPVPERQPRGGGKRGRVITEPSSPPADRQAANPGARRKRKKRH